MYLSDEQREVGKGNFNEVMNSLTRRQFIKGSAAAGITAGATMGAMYFGYGKVTDPVRIGVIGTGDEGQVLIGACNPDYVEIVAIADMRESAIHRAFHGDYKSNAEKVAPRPGIMDVYGYETEAEAKSKVNVYKDYHELLADDAVEAVIIALPLHLHAQAAIDAMKAGKHVLSEKLMAKTVKECKQMARASMKKYNGADDYVLAVGHQRHYSTLYENAVYLIQNLFLGELHAIRAQWHRNNLPGSDSWKVPIPGGDQKYGLAAKDENPVYDKVKGDLNSLNRQLAAAKKEGRPTASIDAAIAQWQLMLAEAKMNPAEFGYKGFDLPDGRSVGAIEELLRWRLWDKTGGGIMAELGSHQLDAASIFISSLSNDKTTPRNQWKMVHPLTVHAVGGRHIFPMDREIGDHVYCMLEFPAPGYDPVCDEKVSESARKAASMERFGYYNPITGEPAAGVESYEKDPNKRIVYTYSSINGSGFGGYGEAVMGTKRALVIQQERDVMLFNNRDVTSKVTTKDAEVVLDTQESGPPVAVAQAQSGPVSRGYKEEIEHWAYCIKNPAPENTPRCNPTVALGDAVVALMTTEAVKKANASKKGAMAPGFVEFKEEWFDVDRPECPEGNLDG
jgi:predicted dehydrogenase